MCQSNRTPVNSLAGHLNAVRKRGRKGISIQRYKGLGEETMPEMNYDQLFDTTMDIQNRKMLKVVLDDAIRADHAAALSKGVSPRDNVLNVRNLDV